MQGTLLFEVKCKQKLTKSNRSPNQKNLNFLNREKIRFKFVVFDMEEGDEVF